MDRTLYFTKDKSVNHKLNNKRRRKKGTEHLWISIDFCTIIRWIFPELGNPQASDQHLWAQIGNDYAPLTHAPFHFWIKRVACIV